MNLAQLLVEYVYLLALPIGVIVLIIVSGAKVIAKKREKNIKKFKIAQVVTIIMTIALTFIFKMLCTESKDEIYFGYKELEIDLCELEDGERKSSQIISPFGSIYRWSETSYHESSKKNVLLKFEVLKSNNSSIIESYLKENKKTNFKNAYDAWGVTWQANEVYYFYESGDTNIEQWIVVYDNIVVKVQVNNLNLYSEIIKKIVVYVEQYFGRSSEIKDGVYYPEINSKPIYTNNICVLREYTYLEYDGRVYISYDYFNTRLDGSITIDLDGMLGEEICTIYQSEVGDFSTEKEKLHTVVEEKKLYKMNGYDEEFRVAIYEEMYWDDGTRDRSIRMYQCLNDIILKKGEDLYKDKFHLENSKYLSGNKHGKDDIYSLSMKSEVVGEFLGALNNGEFIDPEVDDYPELKLYTSYELKFLDKNGIDTKLTVYPEGYVTMLNKGLGVFIVKVDKQECDKIISLIEAKAQ